MVRSAIGEDETLEPSRASRSSSYLEVAGDVGIILGDAPRGGEDCILLESMFGGFLVVCSIWLCFRELTPMALLVLDAEVCMRACIAAG